MHSVKRSKSHFASGLIYTTCFLLMACGVSLAGDSPRPTKAAKARKDNSPPSPHKLTPGDSEAEAIRIIPLMRLPKDLGKRKAGVGAAGVSARAPQVNQSLRNEVSPPLRDLKPTTPVAKEERVVPLMRLPKDLGQKTGDSTSPKASGPAIKQGRGGQSIRSPGVTPGVNFEGINNRNGYVPPDTVGDVGPNHYMQTVNGSFQIFSKTGTSLSGPFDNNTMWGTLGGRCASDNDGDPIVLYDHLADRWLFSQFAHNFEGAADDFHQCIAISQTGDPTGAWYLYDFLISTTKLNDYPKFGVWPDGYYMSVNQFDGLTGYYAGVGAVVFERDKMLQGQAASMVYFDDPASHLGGMLPSDLDGLPPPAGTPNFFMQVNDDGRGYPQDAVEIWECHVDWDTPGNSTFSQSAVLPTAPFDSNMCNGFNCIPQPNTNAEVDSLASRLMYRLAYRNFGTRQTMVSNHTVDADGTNHAGIRWYELRNSGQGWTIYQQGTYAPDDLHRWMGSIAMDSQGNMALGYSVSSGDSCEQPLLNEGFEGGTVPPTGWNLIDTNQNESWLIDYGYARDGTYMASVFYDPALVQQDEILLTQSLDLTSGVLRFYSLGSLYWCRDVNDNCDLEIWIVKGAWDGGADDDIFVGLADGDWLDTYTWSKSSFDLTPLLPGGPVKIAFRYVGLDGAWISLDDVEICSAVVAGTTYPSIRYAGRRANDPLGTLPQGEHSIIEGSGSQTISLGRWGDYSAMSVDPKNDSFWYTQEYYATTSSAGWQTRVASFRFGGDGSISLEGPRFLLLGD